MRHWWIKDNAFDSAITSLSNLMKLVSFIEQNFSFCILRLRPKFSPISHTVYQFDVVRS